jgi:hypothetical protein
MTPEQRTVRAKFQELKRARWNHFPAARKPVEAPDDQGVYIIRSPRGGVLHVGRTHRGKKGLAQRLRQHLAASSSFVDTYLDAEGSLLRRGYYFSFVVIRNSRVRCLVEMYATGALCPAHLGTGE